MFRKKWLASLLSVMMVFAFMPISSFVYAAEGNEGSAEDPTLYEVATNPDAIDANGLYSSKKLELDENGEGTITLEMFSEGEVSTHTTTKPVDIVLVLDMSGSMAYCIQCGESSTHTEKCGVCGELRDSSKHNTSLCTVCGKTEAAGDHVISDKCANCGEVRSSSKHNTSLCTECGKMRYSGYEHNKYNGCAICGAQNNDKVHNKGSKQYKHDYEAPHTFQGGHAFVASGHQFVAGHEYVASGHNSESRISQTKTSAKAFVEKVKAQAEADGQDHTISIVKFASDDSDEVGNDKTGSYNYSQVVCNPTVVDEGGASALESAIDSLSEGGATRADFGMAHAEKIISELNKNTERDSNKVVIMLTDGTPTTKSAWSSDVANKAIGSAQKIKASGAKVYTVGMFTNKPDADSNEGKYMNYVSSNYPSAENMTNPGAQAASGYYLNVGAGINLEDIFQTISEEIAESKTELTADSLISDVITDDFEINGDIAIEASSYAYDGKEETTNVLKWGQKTDITDDMDIRVDNQTINVSGFDFENGFVVDTTEGPQGKKLVITIPIKLKNTTLDGSIIKSNGNGSGIKENPDDPSNVRNFGSPEVKKATEIKYQAGEGGSVSSKGEIIGTNQDASDIQGSNATAAEGYTFINWTDKEGNVVSIDSKFIPEKVLYETYTANFAKLAVRNYEKVYDGNPLEANDPKIMCGDEEVLDGIYDFIYKVGNDTVDRPSYTSVADVTVTVTAVPKEEYADKYNEMTASFTMKVTSRPVTITVDNAWKYVGDDDPAFNAAITSGTLVKDDDLGEIGAERTNNAEEVETYKGVLNATYTTNSNYAVTVEKGDFRIKAEADRPKLNTADGEWPYDGKSHSKTATVTGDGNEYYTVYYNVGDGKWTTEVPTITDAGNKTVQVKATAEGKADLTGSFKLKVNQVAITITVDDASKAYGDDDPAFNAAITEGELVGENDLGEIGAERTNDAEEVGTYEGVLNAKYTANGNYDVTVVKGDFEITQGSYTGGELVTKNAEKVYDGTVLKAEKPTVTGPAVNAQYKIQYSTTYEDGQWKDWKDWTADSQPKLRDASAMLVGIKAVDELGHYGDLEGSLVMKVTPRPVTITVYDETHDYGVTFTEDHITGTIQEKTGDEGLIPGDNLGVSYKLVDDFESMPTAAGTYEDILTAEHNSNSNYEIEVVNGTLKINKKPAGDLAIVLNGTGGSKVYDGTPITAPDATVSGADEDVYEVVVSGTKSITNVGSSKVTYTVKIKDDVENPDSYELPDAVSVEIAVTKRPVKLSSESASKVYDGTPLTKENVKVVGEYGFVSGEATAKATGSVTTVKESGNDGVKNTIEIEEGTGFDADNYDIQIVEEGKLIITPATLTVTPNNKTINVGQAEPEYDGTITGFVNDESESVISKMPTYTIDGDITGAGKYSIIGDGAEADNYVFTYNVGTLTVKSNATPGPGPGPGPTPGPGPGNGGGGGGNIGTVVPATMAPAAAYSLTEVPNEGTPLGNGLLDDHCCILHLLIMLLAMIMLMWYTHDMKKRQARIFELEEELEGYDE